MALEWIAALRDSFNGDFTPAGALTTNLEEPVVARDIDGNTRAASDAVGAVRTA